MDEKAPLTSRELKLLQDISNSLGGMQVLLTEYKAQVDEIIKVRFDENVVDAKKKAASNLRKAEKLQRKGTVLADVARSNAKRYNKGVMPLNDRYMREAEKDLYESRQLRQEAERLAPDVYDKWLKRQVKKAR